jgi:hypothetical protein
VDDVRGEKSHESKPCNEIEIQGELQVNDVQSALRIRWFNEHVYAILGGLIPPLLAPTRTWFCTLW